MPYIDALKGNAVLNYEPQTNEVLKNRKALRNEYPTGYDSIPV